MIGQSQTQKVRLVHNQCWKESKKIVGSPGNRAIEGTKKRKLRLKGTDKRKAKPELCCKFERKARKRQAKEGKFKASEGN